MTNVVELSLVCEFFHSIDTGCITVGMVISTHPSPWQSVNREDMQ